MVRMLRMVATSFLTNKINKRKYISALWCANNPVIYFKVKIAFSLPVELKYLCSSCSCIKQV